MPRSAAQRAARRLKRQMMPLFPFTKLPVELQLLVICKCDMISVRRLFHLSPFVRALFLRYPETALRNLLAQLPTPTARLLSVSWALENAGLETTDTENILDLLRNAHIMEWPTTNQVVLSANDNPLSAIQSLLDIYADVNVAVGLVAQGMHAAANYFVNPHVVVSHFVPTPTEYTRIACNILLVKIYTKLRGVFHNGGNGWKSPFPQTFVRSQTPWQIAQAVSVESFLDACQGSNNDCTVYKMIDKKYTCKECLSEKSVFIRDYFETALELGHHTMRYGPVSLSQAVIEQRKYAALDFALNRGMKGLGHPLKVTDATMRLQNHGWVLYDSIFTRLRLLRDHFHDTWTNFGLFFWDEHRLIDWDLFSEDDVKNSFWEFHNQLRQAYHNQHRNPNWSLSHYQNPTLIEKVKARQILQWSRYSVPCTLEEFLYQKSALDRVADGRPPLLLEHIVPGMVCYICEVDGHPGQRCQRLVGFNN